MNSSDSSESIETALNELKSWKRSVDVELESQFDRVKSLAGRVDRAKRQEKTSQDPQEATPTEPGDLDDQGKFNQLVARRLGVIG